MAPSDPRLLRVYETVLYAGDVAATTAFYADVLGLRLFEDHGDLAAVFRLDDGGMFLLFEPGRASAPGRTLPAHGAEGPGHVAFAVGPGGIDRVAAQLRRHRTEIEGDFTHDWGGRSLYFRDPAGNVVELVEGEAWPPVPRVPRPKTA